MTKARLHLITLAAALVAGCAAGDPQFTVDAPAGFWTGIWHGLISWIALIVGLFNDGVEIYERVNTGGWYDFGFLIGATCLFGASHRTHRHWWGRKSEQDIPPSGHLTVDVSWKTDAAGDAEPATDADDAGETSRG